jgi:hypothetical protein
MKYVLLGMDQILRPNGHALIRESSYFADAVATIARGLSKVNGLWVKVEVSKVAVL